MICIGLRVRSSLSVGVPCRVAAEFMIGFLDDQGSPRDEPLEAVWDWRFERVQPVRKFPSRPGQRHFPGLWWSSATGEHVGFESWLEREHAMMLDFDPAVAAFSSQPFWLRWHDGGRVRQPLVARGPAHIWHDLSAAGHQTQARWGVSACSITRHLRPNRADVWLARADCGCMSRSPASAVSRSPRLT